MNIQELKRAVKSYRKILIYYKISYIYLLLIWTTNTLHSNNVDKYFARVDKGD